MDVNAQKKIMVSFTKMPDSKKYCMDIQDESNTFLSICTVGSEQNGSTSMKDIMKQLLDEIYDYGQVAARRCSKVFLLTKSEAFSPD